MMDHNPQGSHLEVPRADGGFEVMQEELEVVYSSTNGILPENNHPFERVVQSDENMVSGQQKVRTLRRRNFWIIMAFIILYPFIGSCDFSGVRFEKGIQTTERYKYDSWQRTPEPANPRLSSVMHLCQRQQPLYSSPPLRNIHLQPPQLLHPPRPPRL